VIAQLKDFFKLTELGVLKNMIGLEIIRDENSILVNQKSYIDKVVNKFNFNEANNVYNRMVPGSLLHKKLESEDRFDSTKYLHFIGSLLYISTCTRPDVANADGVMSRHMETLADRPYIYLLRVLKYLKTTRMDSLGYEMKRDEEIEIRCYNDLDFRGSKFNRT
jgi:Reverse transcriptase (RNA-dependent DNA polymerase)